MNPNSMAEAQAEYSTLRNDETKKRAQLTRKHHFIVTDDGAHHFVCHTRKDLAQTAPQLSAVLDPEIAAHTIFKEFDSCEQTSWGLQRGTGRVEVRERISYSVLLLCQALKLNRPYDELGDLKATSKDGNTLGNYEGNIELRPRGEKRRAGSRARGAFKTKELDARSTKELEKHRAILQNLTHAERMKYIRRVGLIDVTLKNGKSEKVHLLGGKPREDGTAWYVSFSEDMTMEKLLSFAPGIDPLSYCMAMDLTGQVVLTQSANLDLAQLVWLIHHHPEGLTRANVLQRLADAPAARDIKFHDGDKLNLKVSNLKW